VTGLRLPGFAIGLALMAALVAIPPLVIGAVHGFNGLYGQDAFAYAGYALGPLREALLARQPPPGFPLPPGYPLLAALASIVVGPSDVVAVAVPLVAGASIPVLVALLALELRPEVDRRIALLAGLVGAVSGQLWQSSGVAMSDTPALAAATLGAFATCRFHRTGRGWWLLLAFGALALAIEIRLVYGVVAAVFATVALARLRADLARAPGRSLVVAGGSAIIALAVLAPMLGPMLAAAATSAPVPFSVELGVARFDPLTPFRSTFDTADGHLEYRFPMVAWLALQPVQPYWLGALALAVPFGLVDVLRSRPRRAVELAALIAWPSLVGLVLVLYPYQNPRFVLALLPPLAILSACGIAWISVRLAARAPRASRTVSVGVVLLLVVNAALAWRHVDSFVARQSADLQAIRALAAEIPAGANVVSLGATGALRHDGRDVVELYDLTAPEVDALASGDPAYLVVDAGALEGQWAGTAPGLAFERLRLVPGFIEVDRSGTWTLFVVNP
jgi:4-amino-4-deoxy-L-arabinose transferase-like glycosyltransferase